MSGNFGYLPETRPGGGSKILSPAGAAAIRLGISDRLSIQAEGWADLSPASRFEQGGFAYSLQYILNNPDSEVIYAIAPKYGYTVESASFPGNAMINGHGFSLSLGAWFNNDKKLKPYAAVSGVFGLRNFDLSRTENFYGEERLPYGWAIGAHPGLNYEVNNWLNLNAELPLLYQYNQFDDTRHVLASPVIGLSVDFGVW